MNRGPLMVAVGLVVLGVLLLGVLAYLSIRGSGVPIGR